MEPQTIPLTQLSPGAHALVLDMQENPQVCYLKCLGFCPGAHVELVRRVSRGALSIYRVDDADVALRKETAALISVVLER